MTTTGSHQKTCVFGVLSIDGRQLFRQYNYFNEDTFLLYLNEIKRKFCRFVIFLDRATQHYRSSKVKEYLNQNKDIQVEYFPRGSPDFNAVEECWRQGKDDLLASKYYPKFQNLREAIAHYYRTKRFNLDIVKYLVRESTN